MNYKLTLCAILLYSMMSLVASDSSDLSTNPAIQRFQQYIRINTTGQDGVEKAVWYLRKQALLLRLQFKVYRPAGYPIVVITWKGLNSSLPSIMLNSHIDVVPLIPSEWLYPPFSAHITDNGDIYGRGTQDTKGVGSLYLEAIRKLKSNGVRLQRDLHVTFMPDEETGSARGMQVFCVSPEFEALNVGFAFDEGAAQPTSAYIFSFYDKRPWHADITFYGASGHSGDNSVVLAVDKLWKMIDFLMNFKQTELAKMQNPYDFGAYTSVDINVIQGGYASNVIPESMFLTADFRLAENTNVTEFKALLDYWAEQSGSDTTVNITRREDVSVRTAVDSSNPYWVAIEQAATDLSIPIMPIILPATTNAIYLRPLGIPALGFNPFINTVTRAHGVDEYVNGYTFLRGIDVYVGLITRLGNLITN